MEKDGVVLTNVRYEPCRRAPYTFNTNTSLSERKADAITWREAIPNLSGNASLVELEIDMYSAETFHDVFAVLSGTNIKHVILTGDVLSTEVDLGTTHTSAGIFPP